MAWSSYTGCHSSDTGGHRSVHRSVVLGAENATMRAGSIQ